MSQPASPALSGTSVAAMPALAGVPCTCAALRQLSRVVSAIYDRHLETVGLTTNQYSLLMTLAAGTGGGNEDGGMVPLGRLARRTAADRTTLTRTLKPLVAAGWVALATGPDARRKMVALTAAGQEAVRQAQPAWAAAQAVIERELGTGAVRDLHANIAGAMARLRHLLPAN